MAEEAVSGVPVRGPAADRGIPEEGVQPREKWANKLEFIFTTLAHTISLLTLCRFPYLCFTYGGAIFLIPYVLMLFLCGIPLFFLETALGQYTSEGGVTAWRKLCPMFQGVGIASQIILCFINIYYIVVLAWIIFYLYNSFKSPLPWTTCDNWWNTASCSTTNTLSNISVVGPDSDWTFANTIDDPNRINPAEMEFWSHRVLREWSDTSAFSLHWDCTLCLLLAWVLCYFCVWKGIRYSGKIVYFTVIFPYLLLFILFIRGVTLPGAGMGLRYYLQIDTRRLADLNVWFSALSQVFISFGVCQGVMTPLGSYNKYNNNCYRDCLLLCVLHTATSFFAGFALFSFLGYISYVLGVDVEETATSGIYLIFTTLPKALSMLPGSTSWTVLFFLMSLFLCLDAQFVRVQSLATTISDLFPHHFRKPHARELLVLAVCGLCFLLGLPLITNGGQLLFTLIDTFGVGELSVLFIAFFEAIVIAWVYGADRFYDNIEDMIGYRPFPVLKYCWLFITPLICAIILQFQLTWAGYGVVFYIFSSRPWAPVLGGLLLITPLMCIPVFMLISLCKNAQNLTAPSSDLRQARPHKPILTLCKRVICAAQAQANRTDREHEKIMMEEAQKV